MTWPRQPDDPTLLTQVQGDVDALLNHNLTSQGDPALVPLWSARTGQALQSLVPGHGRLDVDSLKHFRRDRILVDDVPANDLRRSLRNRNLARSLVGGGSRGARRCLLECLEVLRTRSFEDLLLRYPCPPVGHPAIFRHQGFHYTFRWARHVYFLGLMNRILRDRLRDDFVTLDIGSSYGGFSYLVKREHPASRHVLVDLPEQLILARYFLGSTLPQARIAGVSELLREPVITKDLLSDFDFVLLPAPLFERLAARSVDLVTNFASMSEMTRGYFDRYLQSEVFRSAGYFYTINRVEPYPKAFGTDISILDFPITDPEKRLHFGICPIFSVNFLFRRRLLFFTSCEVPPPYFEYIGRI